MQGDQPRWFDGSHLAGPGGGRDLRLLVLKPHGWMTKERRDVLLAFARIGPDWLARIRLQAQPVRSYSTDQMHRLVELERQNSLGWHPNFVTACKNLRGRSAGRTDRGASRGAGAAARNGAQECTKGCATTRHLGCSTVPAQPFAPALFFSLGGSLPFPSVDRYGLKRQGHGTSPGNPAGRNFGDSELDRRAFWNKNLAILVYHVLRHLGGKRAACLTGRNRLVHPDA